MRIRTLAAAGIGALLVLTGCVGGDPLPTLPPEPTSTPIFASEEEALAAAEEAYAAYQRAVDEALQVLDSSKLEEVATGPALSAALDSVDRLRAEGSHQEGSTIVTTTLATDLSALTEPGASAPLQIYACLDLTGVRIIAADGSGSQSNVADFPMLVTLHLDGSRLLVEEETVWDAESFC